MEILSRNDLFKLKNQTLVAEYDFDTLITLYQPIVGYAAVSVYMMIWSMTKHSVADQYFSHDGLLNRMKMSPGEFVEARKKLEAVSLLKTYLYKDEQHDLYTYCLRAPETPKNFFDNILLHGLLIKAIGEKEASKQKCIFKYDDSKIEGSEISATIANVFKPEYDESYLDLLNQRDEVVGRVRARIKSKFDYDLFIKFICDSSQIKKTSFTKKHLKEFERLSALYGVSEEHMAQYAIDAFNPNLDIENRFDFDLIIKDCKNQDKFPFLRKEDNNNEKGVVSSSSKLGNKINLMETVSPKDFLSYLQNGTKPVESDLTLIDRLSKELCLNPSVINVLLDYVLSVNNNRLSANYVMKVGATLVRENISTAYDAMNYFNHKNKKSNYVKTKNVNKIETTNTQTESKKEEINDEEWENFLKEMED